MGIDAVLYSVGIVFFKNRDIGSAAVYRTKTPYRETTCAAVVSDRKCGGFIFSGPGLL